MYLVQMVRRGGISVKGGESTELALRYLAQSGRGLSISLVNGQEKVNYQKIMLENFRA